MLDGKSKSALLAMMNLERFWSNVIMTSTCWLWQGNIDCWGYGTYNTQRVHRISWKLHKGDIPPKKRVKILCGNRNCLNPEHLSIRLVETFTGKACVEWPGTRSDKGYGQVRVDGKLEYVHRIAWEQVNGPVPEGLLVLHHCDNPPCYNEEHLFVGTNSDNVQDMLSKGRGYWQQRNAA